jgi:hypothetical protein
MYYIHNVRTNLQDWKNRLYRAPYEQFGHQLKYCVNNVETNKLLFTIIQGNILKYPYTDDYLQNIADAYERSVPDLSFVNEVQHSSHCYQLLKHFIKTAETHDLHTLTAFYGRDFEDTKKNIIEGFITPIFHSLHDELDKSNSTIYLLEKYKRRTEWFTCIQLMQQYSSAEKNYEQIFEDDLRLFLFDQGIDYPFSTPKSPSGRGDIIGSIDTNDPLIIEIKILDKEKGYGKNRVIDGFSQIIKYTNDYSKDVGYLVIFNTDAVEIDFSLKEKSNTFPPMVVFNNKTYFLITINLNREVSASKIGKTEAIIINESDLTKSNSF